MRKQDRIRDVFFSVCRALSRRRAEEVSRGRSFGRCHPDMAAGRAAESHMWHWNIKLSQVHSSLVIVVISKTYMIDNRVVTLDMMSNVNDKVQC